MNAKRARWLKGMEKDRADRIGNLLDCLRAKEEKIAELESTIADIYQIMSRNIGRGVTITEVEQLEGWTFYPAGKIKAQQAKIRLLEQQLQGINA